MPFNRHKTEIVKAFEDYAMAENFGWTDEYIQNGLEPSRKRVYLAILRGRATAGDK